MTDIYTWSITAADNDDADSGINWAEFQDPDTVNNSARVMMARVATWRNDLVPKRSSAGTANAYTVASDSAPSTFSGDFVIYFKADRTNSGSSTLTVNGLAAKPLRAKSGTALVSGEIQAGTVVAAYYALATDEFLIVNSGFHANALLPTVVSAYAVGLKAGMTMIWNSNTLPAGWLWEDGSAVLRTTYSELDTNLYVGDSANATANYGYRTTSTSSPSSNRSTSGQYIVLPDSRGRNDVGKDNQGGLAASRVTSAGSGIDAATIFAVGGAETVTIAALNLPNITIHIVDPGHTHPYVRVDDTSLAGSSGNSFYDSTGTVNTSSNTTGITAFIDNTARGGAQTALNKMPPTIVRPKIILASPAAANATVFGTNGVPYTFDSTTTAADPGAGKLRINHATPGSATAMYISETGANAEPLGPYLDTWDDALTTVKGRVHFYKIGAVGTFAIYSLTGSVTDSGDYKSLTLTYITGNGSFTNGDALSVLYYANGGVEEAPTYTVATLPTSGPNIAIASDGRKNGEGGGSGTGVLCFRISTSWFAVDTGAAVAA
jgi:hypothetical protein